MEKRLLLLVASILLMCGLVSCVNKTVDKSITINNKIEENNKEDQKQQNRHKVIENENKEKITLLKEIHDDAEEGKVIGCDFEAKNNIIDDVQKAWGQEEKWDYVDAAKGMYFTFKDKDVVFGVNKGGVIFEVRTFNKEIKTLSLSDIINYFGNPDYDITSSLNERIIGYIVNDDFKILFVFSNGNDKNPILDHYSVLYPKGTKNMMADDPGREW